jgi:GNAT superfamily N-acetyltransferase
MNTAKPTTPFTIRAATAVDADAVCELLFGLKSMYGSCSEADLREFADHYGPTIRAAIDSSPNHVWVAEVSDGRLVGFISMTRRLVLRLAGHVGVLEEIFVRSDWRRAGVASALWHRAAEHLRSGGVGTVEVVTSLAHPGQREFARSLGLEWYSSIHRVFL